MKKIFKVFFILIALYALSYLLIFVKSGKDRFYIKDAGSPPLIIAHGGTKRLAPENSMLAFNIADSLNVDMLEVDVQLTKDSVLIAFHDDILDKRTDAKGYVKHYTLNDLREVNFAYNFKDSLGNYSYREEKIKVTTLEQILEKYADKYPICIEIKNYEENVARIACDRLYELIGKYDIKEKVIISCFDEDVIKYFRKISNNEIYTAASLSEAKTFVILNLAYLPHIYLGGCDVLQIPVERSGYKLDDKRLIDAAHRKNIAVHYWTINDPQEMKRLIRIGADGIITDRPDIAAQVLKEMKYVR